MCKLYEHNFFIFINKVNSLIFSKENYQQLQNKYSAESLRLITVTHGGNI